MRRELAHETSLRVFETTYFGMPFIFLAKAPSPSANGQKAAQIW